jgi:hypothetical protein
MINGLTQQEKAIALKSFVRSEVSLTAAQRQGAELAQLASTDEARRIMVAQYFARKVKR